MKLRTIVFSLSMIVALAGGLTLLLATQETPHSVDKNVFSDEPRHLITPEMVKRTAAETLKPAPVFHAVDYHGRPVDLGNSRKPQFVYFVLDGCPCSIDAEPLYQKLYDHFHHEVEFVGVTNGDPGQAKKWATEMLMPYPLIPDPKLEIIHGFGATNSASSALVGTDGKIVKMWPGYSKSLLADMNSTLAKTLNEPERPFDAAYAPVKQATGCAFAPEKP